MPERPFTRQQSYLLPPSYEELVAADHPVRYVAAFVEALEPQVWEKLGVGPAQALGSPRYAPKLLVSVWVAGFMFGLRTSRGVERACHESLPFRWLSAGQSPDHNTLWRFFAEHRDQMEELLDQTVQTAAHAGLVDLAFQAVDGSKVLANVSKDGTLTIAQLGELHERTLLAIADLEAQHVGEDDPPPPGLPAELQHVKALQERVASALARVQDAPADTKITLGDPDARYMQTRQGTAPAYNAQAVVVALDPEQAGRRGRLILAAKVSTDASDNALLASMIEAAQIDGQPVPLTVADGGYYSGSSLQQCADAGYQVVVPTSHPKQAKDNPYSKEHFHYDDQHNIYTCPQGQPLSYRGDKRGRQQVPMAIYRADSGVCCGCVAAAQCNGNRRQGKSIERGPYEQTLQTHRQQMASEEARQLGRARKTLIEPVFGIIKERQGGRRTLVRGLAKVNAEWTMQAVAFNLNTLARVWAGQLAAGAANTGTTGWTAQRAA